jgi:phage tail protein X
MNRYAESKIIKNANGKQQRSSIILPNVQLSPNDTYIQTTTVKRLDLLAFDLYGDVTLWWVIASANGLGKGSMIVPQNTLLRIPDISNLESQIQKVNTSR